MTGERNTRRFATRPSDPDVWVRAPTAAQSKSDAYTARLTIDVTPALRGRIKIVAFRRGLTATEMLRGLLEREFPLGADGPGDAT